MTMIGNRLPGVAFSGGRQINGVAREDSGLDQIDKNVSFLQRCLAFSLTVGGSGSPSSGKGTTLVGYAAQVCLEHTSAIRWIRP
jgi:hypothetical protein